MHRLFLYEQKKSIDKRFMRYITCTLHRDMRSILRVFTYCSKKEVPRYYIYYLQLQTEFATTNSEREYFRG